MSYIYSARRDILLIICLCIFSILGCIYVSNSSRDIVFMDYWDKINLLIPEIYNNDLKLSTLFCPFDRGQSNFLQMILVAFNIKYTNLNCLWEEYAGIICINFTVLLLYCYSVKCSEFYKKNRTLLQVFFISIMLVMFSLNQWEILSLEFSLSFMIRVFSYYLAFVLYDYSVKSKQNKWFLITGGFCGLLVIFMSQLYWIAMIATIFVVYLHNYVNKYVNFKNFILLFIPIFLSIYIYVYGICEGVISKSGDGLNFNLISYLTNLPLRVLLMLSGSIFHQSFIDMLNTTYIMLIGIILIIVITIPLYIYIYYKVYEYTYMPLLVYLYGLISMFVIILGRSDFGDLYLTSSRYSCETLSVWSGLLLMIIFIYQKLNESKNEISKGLIRLNLFIMVAVIVINLFTCITEWKIAPHRGVYKDNCIKMMTMYDGENYTYNELELLQSSSKKIIKGIEYLEKYSLNVFNDDYIGADLSSAVTEGVYDDNWCGETIFLKIRSGDDGKILIKGFVPEELISKNYILTIKCNQINEFYYNVDSKDIIVNLEGLEANSLYTLKIIANWTLNTNDGDTRVLSWKVISIE